MKNYITSLFLLSGIVTTAQNSILELAEGYQYELSIPFAGDTIVHVPNIDLANELQLEEVHRIIEDDRGTSRIYYWNRWRISYHEINGQRSGSTISRLIKRINYE